MEDVQESHQGRAPLPRKVRAFAALAYVAAAGTSVYGQFTGIDRWMVSTPDMPPLMTGVVTSAMIILLDAAFIALTLHMAFMRQQGERAIPNILGMFVTGSLSIGIAFFGHWGDTYGSQLEAVFFSGASLVAIMIYLITTPLSEDPERVNARNVRASLVWMVKRRDVPADVKRVLIQAVNYGHVSDRVRAEFDNDMMANLVLGVIDPNRWNLSSKEPISVPEVTEVVDTVDVPDVETSEPAPAVTVVETVPEVVESADADDIEARFTEQVADMVNDFEAYMMTWLESGPDRTESASSVARKFGKSTSTVTRRANRYDEENS